MSVHVTQGTAYIPVVNVGCNDALLYPSTALGTLDFVNVVSLPSGVTEVPSGIVEAPAGMATASSQTASLSVQQQVENVDLSSLSVEE